MFLHIGDNISVYKGDIIAIISKDTIEKSGNNKKIISIMKEKGMLYNDIEDVKTYILALDREGRCDSYSLYASNISSITLLNRK